MEIVNIAPTFILLVAMYTDIKSRKIYNKWIVASLVIAIASTYYFSGFDGLKQGAIAAMLSLLLTLPFVLLGALGAGDMKLLFAFSFTTTYVVVFTVTVLSFVWASLIGLAVALARKQLGHLISNTAKILSSNPPSKESMQKMPFTIAIFLAWLTYIFLGIKQGYF